MSRGAHKEKVGGSRSKNGTLRGKGRGRWAEVPRKKGQKKGSQGTSEASRGAGKFGRDSSTGKEMEHCKEHRGPYRGLQSDLW